MIDVLLRGFGVGLAVAAPVGAMGLLTIRRTLLGGWPVGFATGLGIALADATYGLAVAAGFAVTGLLVSYAGPVRLVGGLLMTWLGVSSLGHFFRTSRQPDAPASARPVVATSIVPAFATAYGLTLSNPATIIAFTGLIAGLGVPSAEGPYLLVVGVFVGSALWWLILTVVTRLAASRVTPRATRWLDLISGIALAIWGLSIAFSALG